jgi:hypothetical protein
VSADNLLAGRLDDGACIVENGAALLTEQLGALLIK